jgi:hypothetical protein
MVQTITFAVMDGIVKKKDAFRHPKDLLYEKPIKNLAML